MQLIRFGVMGKEKPGILSVDGKRRDLSEHFTDWNYAFFNDSGLERLARFVATHPLEKLPTVDEKVRWGAPVARPGKVMSIGLKYSDHPKESGMPVPTEPIVFMKAANAVVGAGDELLNPRKSA